MYETGTSSVSSPCSVAVAAVAAKVSSPSKEWASDEMEGIIDGGIIHGMYGIGICICIEERKRSIRACAFSS